MTYKPSSLTHTPSLTYQRKPSLWYVIVCNVNCEKRAEQGLKAKGFATYLPMLTKTGIRGPKRQAHTIEKPLFTRYLFVGWSNGEMPFYNMRNTNGVEYIVRTDGLPLGIPSPVIEDIMRRETMGEFDLSKEPKALTEVGLSAGQEMEILSGPFSGITAKIRALVPGRKAEIIIKVLGSDQKVKMPLAELRPVA